MPERLRKLVEYFRLGGCVDTLPVYWDESGRVACSMSGIHGVLLSDPKDREIQIWEWVAQPGAEAPDHFHKVHEYLLMNEGGVFECNSRRTYHPGQLAEWSPNTAHKVMFPDGGRYTLVFRPSLRLDFQRAPK